MFRQRSIHIRRAIQRYSNCRPGKASRGSSETKNRSQNWDPRIGVGFMARGFGSIYVQTVKSDQEFVRMCNDYAVDVLLGPGYSITLSASGRHCTSSRHS
uniref:Uncharacterized protein n=1 Tax=Cacopsylla melanoneura TaxID=428564 RepID=A0A8D8ZH35_9HEMI